MSVEQYSVEQDITLLSDEFSAVRPSLQDFLVGKESYVLKAGFDGTNIAAIYGYADEWSVSRTEKGCTVSVTGRDGLKLAMTTHFQHSYFFTKPTQDVKNRYGESVSYSVGNTMASSVAANAAAQAGLKMIWQCPDYPIVSEATESAGFNDTVANVLVALIEPLNKTEMFKIDLLVSGSTVIAKKRQWPYAPDYTISLSDIRIMDFKVTRVGDDKVPIRNIYVYRDERNERTGWDTEPATKSTVIETLDIDGKVLTREISTVYYFIGVVIKEEKLVYTRLVDDKDVTLASEDIVSYDYGGTMSSDYNKIYTKDTVSIVYDPSPPGSEKKRYKSKDLKTSVSYKYSPLDEILMEDTITMTKMFNTNGTYKVDTTTGKPQNMIEQNTVSYRAINKDLIETTQTQYVNGTFVDKKVIIQSGQLPGPKMVGKNRNINRRDTIVPWYDKVTVSQYGRDIELSDDRMTRGQLLQMAQEIKTEKQHDRYTLNLSIIPMPWIRKGMKIRIAGLLNDGLGNTFDMSELVFLVTRASSTMSEKQHVGQLEGVAWR